jgi:flagellar hook-length control protein FliK
MNGEEMNSANVVLNLAGPVASSAADTDVAADGAAFSLALASAQQPEGQDTAVVAEMAVEPVAEAEIAAGGTEGGALALIASMLNVAPPANDNEAACAESATSPACTQTPAALAGAAVSSADVLAAMLSGKPQPASQAVATETAAADATALAAQSAAGSVAQSASTRTAPRNGVEQRTAEATPASRQPEAAPEASPELEPLTLLDKLQSVAAAANTGQGSSTSGGGAQQAAAMHMMASGAREAAVAGATSAPAADSALREPVGSARWADELGARMMLMTVRGQQQGSLLLTPEHLGPLEVQISVNKDTANVWFSAQHADTRAALAEAMPRLRELLSASGLSLGQAGVSEHAPRGAQAEAGTARLQANAGVEPVTGSEAPVAWRPWRPGLIDTYA